MNVTELELALQQMQVPKTMYLLLKGGRPHDCLCLVKEDLWRIYYSERGGRWDLAEFEQESDACEYFYNELKPYGKANK